MARRGAGRSEQGGASGRYGQGRPERGRGAKGQRGDAGRGGRGGYGDARGGRSSDGRGGRGGDARGGRGGFQGKQGGAVARGRDGSRGTGGYGGYGGAVGARSGSRPASSSRGDLIEGRRATDEALELGLPITRALVQKDGGQGDPALSQLAARLEASGIEVERVAKPILDSLSSHGAHQGVMLRVRPYRYAELHDVLERAGEGPALVIVLDHVTDEGNFGAIVRTAEVVGATGVVVARARAARVGVGAYKTSAGAGPKSVLLELVQGVREVGDLRDGQVHHGAATEHAHDVIWDAPLAGRVALVMGSEGSGISRLVREHCDFEFRLPQRGRVESLNVAQATTAIAYEWLRRCETDGDDATGVSGVPGDSPAAAALDLSGSADLPDTSDFDFLDGDLRG